MPDCAIHLGDALSVLRTLPTESVHCCITSPPYYGMRSYSGLQKEIGLEETPEEYITALTEVFTEVHRVLRSDGTLWLNIGDSFPAGNNKVPGLRPKNLIGIPWKLAFSLQDQGWYLRSDIIWHKSNPLPEATKDRPTRSHEYIFLFSKQQHYYYDYMAVREPSITNSEKLRNQRDVWIMSTQADRSAHFAMFPKKLADLCIQAGSSCSGCCSLCGSPVLRSVADNHNKLGILGRKAEPNSRTRGGGFNLTSLKTDEGTRLVKGHNPTVFSAARTVGWNRSCKCGSEIIPCTVLDPFCGSGTTMLVANETGRSSIGIDIMPDYLPIMIQTLSSVNPVVIIHEPFEPTLQPDEVHEQKPL